MSLEAKREENLNILNLEGKRVGKYLLRILNLKKGRFPEEQDLELFLENKQGNLFSRPLVYAKYFRGRGKWMPVWLEVTYRPYLKVLGKKAEIGILGSKIENDLFKELSQLIPPGGRIFVMYITAGTEATKSAFEKGIPRMLTPLGFLLWKNGFRWFKDWYFAEGWAEGGQKLQANKPLNQEVQKKRETETIIEIVNFFKESVINPEIKKRGDYILKEIKDTWCKQPN